MMLTADIAAVAEGQVAYHSSKRLPYGSKDLDRHLQRLLDKQGTRCSSAYAIQKLKEACTRMPNPDMNAAEVGTPWICNLHNCSMTRSSHNSS